MPPWREGASNETELAGLRGSGLFEWALEHNHTTAVAQEELWKLESLTAHTWYEYHTAHCMYIWHLAGIAWDAVLRGDSPVYIPTKAVDHKHVHHCRKVVAIGPKMAGVSVQVFFSLEHVQGGIRAATVTLEPQPCRIQPNGT